MEEYGEDSKGRPRKVTYSWCGTNDLDDFKEGNELAYPGLGTSWIDSIKPSSKEGRLIMITLSERHPRILGPRKHEIQEQISFLYLDPRGAKVINSDSVETNFSIRGQSLDYQEKFRRLRELQGESD